MFRDELRDKVWNEVRQQDVRAFSAQLTPDTFKEAACRAKVRVGCSALNLVNLAWLGIAMSIHAGKTFGYVLTTTLKLLEDQQDFFSTPLGKQKKKAQRRSRKGRKKSKHDPYRNDPTQISEEAFVQARQRMPLRFWAALLAVLAENFQRSHSQHIRFNKDFRLLAMDGSMLELPNVAPLRKHYGTPKNASQKKAAPQARIVMLILPGTRIPIAYEVAPLCDSELTLAGRLVQHVQENDLLLVDRGFSSYGLFWQIQKRGAYFGTRLKTNIKYKKTKQLGRNDWLIRWAPKDSSGQWKALALPPSIDLRVIKYQFPGFRPSSLLTNVLDPKRVSYEDWVRLAQDCDEKGKFKPGLYHRRWEIETSYRELKVELRASSLRGQTPASVEYELAGRVVYYLLIRWLIVKAAEKHGLEPLQISFCNALREVEQMHQTLVTSDPTHVSRTLLPRLLERIASSIVPFRPGRHYPRPNDTQPKDRGHGQKQLSSKLSKRINTKRQTNKRKRRRQA